MAATGLSKVRRLKSFLSLIVTQTMRNMQLKRADAILSCRDTPIGARGTESTDPTLPCV